ncbi:MAG: DUF1648 domain-containing protein [Caldilineales bacterium]|nr:DUF1648 domain-containing protein [Caldilineales bacterium]
MAFRPLPFPHRRLAWLLALILALLASALLAQALRTPPGPSLVILLALAGLVGGLFTLLLFRLLALERLDYWVERDAIRVHWAGDSFTLPLHLIEHVQPAAADAARPQWWRWPALWAVSPWTRGPETAFATRGPAQCLALITPTHTYLLSPQDGPGFMAAVAARQQLGPARALRPAVQRAGMRLHWFWRDPLAPWLIMGGLGLSLLLFALLIWRFPGLPAMLPLHYDAAGAPDRLGPRQALFLLPLITGLIWFTNGVLGVILYERQRVAAYLLWGGALLLQGLGLIVLRNLLALYLV